MVLVMVTLKIDHIFYENKNILHEGSSFSLRIFCIVSFLLSLILLIQRPDDINFKLFVSW